MTNIKSDNNSMQAFWVGMGSLSALALSILSAAILSRYFDKHEYGTFKQITYIYNTLLIIFTAGLPAVFSYYLPRYTLAEGKEIVWKITKVLFLSGFLFSAFIYVFSGLIAQVLKNPELTEGLKTFAPVPVLLLPTLGLEGILATYKKSIYIAIYNTISRLIMLLCIVLPIIFFGGSYINAIYGWLVASIFSFALAFFFKMIPFKGVEVKKAALSYKEIFTYSLPLVLASFWGIAIKSANQFFISRYFGADVFAEFSNGFIELPLVGMVTSATSIVLTPVFSKMIHDKLEIDVLVNTWQTALAKSAIIIYPLVIFCIVNAETIVTILYSKSYIDSTIYFQIAMVLNFFNIIIFSPLLFAMGKTKFYSNMHMVFAFVNWGIGYLIVIIFKSPIILAIFSVAMSILMVLVVLHFVAKLLNISFYHLFPVKILTKLMVHQILIVLVIKIVFVKVFDQLNPVLSLALNFLIYLLLLQVTAKFFKLNYLEVFRPLLNKFYSKSS